MFPIAAFPNSFFFLSPILSNLWELQRLQQCKVFFWKLQTSNFLVVIMLTLGFEPCPPPHPPSKKTPIYTHTLHQDEFLKVLQNGNKYGLDKSLVRETNSVVCTGHQILLSCQLPPYLPNEPNDFFFLWLCCIYSLLNSYLQCLNYI